MDGIITVITLHKRSGKYVVHRRDRNTGLISSTAADRLTNEEAMFCNVAERFHTRFDGTRITRWG